MSVASGSGAPPPAGVVQNSALSFVSSAQVMQAPETDNATASDAGNLQETSGEQTSQGDRHVPPGLKAVCAACRKTYPDQPNPLQVTTRLKYWLGGEDPLDYISMYWSPGRPEKHVPPHWHYISFGLSDLHGDGRVHPTGGPDSGYGFELTFRLESADPQPPLWPAQLCQALARYVFITGNKLCAGDHISWHRSLEGATRGRLRHLLVASDAVMRPIHTIHGNVEFLQIVGCTGRELKAAQRGSGFEVLKLIGNDPNCGGPWLVTRIRRRRSACNVRINRKTPARSPLSGVTAKLSWAPLQSVVGESASHLSAGLEEQIKETLQRGLTAMSLDSVKLDDASKMSTDSFEMSSIERALPQIPETLNTSWNGEDNVQYMEGVHIVMSAEGASLLPLAIDARVRMGAHFTWRARGAAVTLTPAAPAPPAPPATPAAPSPPAPYAARRACLQVVLSESEAEELSTQVAPLANLSTSDSETDSDAEESPEPPTLPLTIRSRGLMITVLPESHFL